MISRVMESTKEQIGEEQGEFMSGKGLIDQIYVLKQLVESTERRGKTGKHGTVSVKRKW